MHGYRHREGRLEDLDVPVIYQDNVNAGTAHVTAGLADVAGYQGSNALSTFTINKAPTSTRISCPSVAPYTGHPVELCSAALLMGTQLGALSVRYRDNTGPGIAYATAMFPGDSNYTASGADQTFLIGGPTTVTVTCASGSTYTGSALTPCTATAKADDGFSSTPLIVTYGNNVNAGTATATETYAGDGAGHLGSTGTATFTIAKAPSVVTVECAPASVVYTGAAFTPCTSTVTGAGTLAAAVAPVTYSSNTGAGTATAAATYAGDSNHLGATGSTTFTIEKAPVVVSLTCPASADFTGATLTPCTATATGPGGLTTTVPVAYTSNTYPGTATATATATFAGDANHLSGTATATFKVIGFTLKGFYPPVRTFDTATFWNVARAGSTVPLKFEAFLPNGTETTNPTTLGATFTTTRVPCTATPPTFPNTGPATSGDATISYDTRSGQFTERWKTAKGVTGCFRVTTTSADHSQLTAYFILL